MQLKLPRFSSLLRRRSVRLKKKRTHSTVSREKIRLFSDSFVNSQEWTLSRNVPDLRLGIVGSLSSGKSALVHRYLTGSYMQDESPEGGRFKKEVVTEGQSYLLLIRDEGGTPELQFSCWVDAVLLVFSLENEPSFNALYNYYTKMSHFRNAADLPLILVGTQDAISESNPRVIDDARARKLASDLKRCSYYETCATYGLNVERVFQDACQKIVQQKLASLTPTHSRPSTPVGHPLRGPNYFMPNTTAPTNSTNNHAGENIPSSSSTNHVSTTMTTTTGHTNNGFSSHPQSGANNVSTTGSYVSSPIHSVNYHPGVNHQKDAGSRQITTAKEVRLERPAVEISTTGAGTGVGHGILSNLTSREGKESKELLATPCSTPTTSRKTRRRSNLFPPLKKGDDDKKLRNGEVGSGRVIPIRQGYLYKRSCKALNKEWKKKYVTLTNDGRLTYHPSLHDYMDDVHGKEIPLMHTTVKIPGQKPRGSRPAGTTNSASSHQVNELASDLGILTVAGGNFQPHSSPYYSSNSSTSSSPLLSTFAKHGKDRERESLLGNSGSGSHPNQSQHHLHQQQFHLASARRGSVPLANFNPSINDNSGVLNGSEIHLITPMVPNTSPLLSKLDTPNVKKRHRRMKSSGAKNLEVMEDSDGYEFIVVSLDNKQWHFEATNTEDREAWVTAIEQQILNSLQANESSKTKSRMTSTVDHAAVQSIRTSIPGNTHCVDCDTQNPDWASLNLGALMCIECSGVHRNLGSHISRVRSLDLDDWSPEYISVMVSLGNMAVNNIWEGNPRGRIKPTPNSSREEKERWIRSKYEFKEFILPNRDSSTPLGQQLLEAVCKGDVKSLAWILALASAAGTLTEQVNSHVGARDSRTALHLAAAMGSLPMTQLLLWNNANVKALDTESRTALVYAKSAGSQEVQDLLVHSGCPDTVSTAAPLGVVGGGGASLAAGGNGGGGTLSRRRGSVSKKTSEVFEKLPASII